MISFSKFICRKPTHYDILNCIIIYSIKARNKVGDETRPRLGAENPRIFEVEVTITKNLALSRPRETLAPTKANRFLRDLIPER